MSAGARRGVHGRGEGYTGAPGTASGARVRLGVHESGGRGRRGVAVLTCRSSACASWWCNVFCVTVLRSVWR